MILVPVYTSNSYTKVNINKIDMITKNDKIDEIVGLTSAYYKKEFSNETIKGLSLILKWNYEIDKNKTLRNFIDKTTFLKKYEKKEYERIKKAIRDTIDVNISLKNKEYICIYYITKVESESDNIKKYANPWDCIKQEYKETNNKGGVSLNSFNELCNLGYNYKETLIYFFKDIKITP